MFLFSITYSHSAVGYHGTCDKLQFYTSVLFTVNLMRLQSAQCTVQTHTPTATEMIRSRKDVAISYRYALYICFVCLAYVYMNHCYMKTSLFVGHRLLLHTNSVYAETVSDSAIWRVNVLSSIPR